ncbi:RNA polymerase sigma factor [Chitinophaga sp. XS-30]|uniref:RNA polymerase sigma factor n=1 Tax=Chitinophaga sp. XS-30 TaxID=2604421 RepID=UPI0011DE434D|nr:sigma-70 family RNA polymerase sigma factor [Chitinophaga sp. XS-30]QEH42885.1 sigma-70 family RNA polymerase sigma factor [Chitinophaga sp. XS-30]
MDELQFIQQIDQHQHILHKICRLYRDSKEDREDLFQEMVLQLWKAAPSFEGRSKFSTWMYRIALSTALLDFRKKRPPVFYPEILPDRPEHQPEQSMEAEQLMEALKKLEDADKALITLYLEDLSYQEIAEITGISENYVGVKLNRIKVKLQKWTS